MPIDVIMPQMGESIFEGTITKWLKKPGDKVERDEPLFEISTDKVDAEIPSPAAGVLKEIKVPEGQTVPIQTVVALIDSDGAGAAAAPAKKEAKPAEPAQPEKAAAKAAKKEEPKAEAAPSKREAKPEPPLHFEPPAAAPKEEEEEEEKEEAAPRGDGRKIRSSPLVRRLAREHNLDLSQIRGTGAGGRISKQDVLAAVESGAGRAPAAARPGAPPPAGGAPAHATLEVAVPRERLYFGRHTVQPLSVMRQRIAEHMVVSKRTSPHVYSIDEADMTRIVQLRSKAKEEFEKRFDTKLTYMPFFVRATVEALRAFPQLNASLDGTNLVLHQEFNIGIAVALDWGLIVPVVKNAEEKNFLGLARAMNDLAERARAKKLKPEEVQESTFSITNPGVFGGLMGLPVINQPNAAILGLGAIQKRAVVIDDAIAIRSMVYLTLSYDHRIVDGAIAHQFIGKLKQVLENWSESVV